MDTLMFEMLGGVELEKKVASKGVRERIFD